MNCSKCNNEMKEVQLCVDAFGSSPYLFQKRKDKDNQRDNIKCMVCTGCGYIELYSKVPQKFK